MLSTNPQMRAAVDANPGMRELLSNPETLRQFMNPQTMQAAAQFQQRMSGQGGGQGGSGAPAAGDAVGMPDMSALMGMMGGGAFGGGGGGGGGFNGGVPPVADPETAYATQIEQLVSMGFFDRESNIRALQQTGGNVNAAVERLLGS